MSAALISHKSDIVTVLPHGRKKEKERKKKRKKREKRKKKPILLQWQHTIACHLGVYQSHIESQIF
jgi:hypothetical protein